MASRLTKKQQTDLTEKLMGVIQKNNALQLRLSADRSVNEMNVNQISGALNRIHGQAIGKELPTVITIPARFGGYVIDGIGTIYGGDLNVETGVLTNKYQGFDGAEGSWIYTTSWGNSPSFRCVPTPTIINVASSVTPNVFCDGYTTVNANMLNTGLYDMAITQNGLNIRMTDSRFDNATDLKNALAGKIVLYEIETPETYTLTPQQMIQLLDQL